MAEVLSVTSGTATQSSGLLNATRTDLVLLTLDVTAGTSLSLTLAVDTLASDGSTWFRWTTDTTAVTGVATRRWLLIAKGGVVAADFGTGINAVRQVPVPRIYRVTVVHGNANAATYTVDAKDDL